MQGLTPIITYWRDCKINNETLAPARNKEISTENLQNKNKACFARLGIAAGYCENAEYARALLKKVFIKK
ncbi:MAG TPA: hypothetical protein PKK94_27170 [Leptospiraceae bacterium]|nr:hypothetical protein [Leptospiraceae bacterium]